MPMFLTQAKLRHEAVTAPGFASEIASTPGCENLRQCIQCGTCSGVCPMSPYMDYTPRQIVALTRAGLKDDVLKCHTIWLCTSCYACSVACPKAIGITDVMYALKRRAIDEGVYPRRFSIPMLAKLFTASVRATGRSTEGPLILKLAFRTNPFSLFRQAKLGLGLLRTGRFSLMRESIRRPDELRAVLDALDQPGGS